MDLAGLERKVNQKGTVYFESKSGEIAVKACSKCAEVKELGEFCRNSKKLGGRDPWCRKCHAEYRQANKERVAGRQAKYRQANKERVAERMAEYRQANKERIAGRQAEWQRNNPEKKRMQGQRRRARKAALPATLTDDQYAETLAYFGNACALTGEKLNLTQEHALPLAIGHGGTIRENMYPMVDRLNFSKGDRNIFEWFEANRQRFELSQARFDRLIAWLASANAMTIEEYRDYVYWCHANKCETVA